MCRSLSPSALPRFASAPFPQNETGMAKSGRKAERRLALLRGGIGCGCAYGLAASCAKGGSMPMGKDTGGGGAPGLLAVRKVGGAEPAAVRKVGGGTRGA